jgi:hypothetical protein
MAMATYPWVARASGYTFRTGTSVDLRDDGRAVLAAVWGEKGLLPPKNVASYAERYDGATTWIVAYHRNRPVGVMGLLDMRVASITLDLERRLAPRALDLATTREIGRLAIVKGHRGGAQTVMIGLLREMLAWSKANRIERLFAGSVGRLYEVFSRFNPSARLIDAPPDPGAEDPVRFEYFAKIRAYGKTSGSVMYTFDVAGASPWRVVSEFLARSAGRRGSASERGVRSSPERSGPRSTRPSAG